MHNGKRYRGLNALAQKDHALLLPVSRGEFMLSAIRNADLRAFSTPLQFEYYLTRALEEAYKVGQKPVGADMIENVLAKDINGLEPRLTRQGYNAKVLAELLEPCRAIRLTLQSSNRLIVYRRELPSKRQLYRIEKTTRTG